MSFGPFDQRPLPPAFEPARAMRTHEELVDVALPGDFRALLGAAAGNSSYLARLMLRERAFLPELARRDPDDVLAQLIKEALGAAEAPDQESAMRRLRAAKRKVALT